jgi:hypothetical protein
LVWAKAIDLSAEGAYEGSGVSRDRDFCPVAGELRFSSPLNTQEG